MAKASGSEREETSPLKKGIIIGGMLLFGTCTVVIQKIIFSMEYKQRDTGKTVKFEKPWFQTVAMFIGMLGCLLVYEVYSLIQKVKKRGEDEDEDEDERTTLINGSGNSSSFQDRKEMAKWKQYIAVIPPSLCDMFATAMMNVGLLWIPASVWQMLRGSMVVFSAVFTRIFFRKLRAYQWLGVGVVTFALIMVSFSIIMASGGNGSDSSDSSEGDDGSHPVILVILGCVLVVLAQIIQASQIVIEEYLMKKVSLHPVLIVGLEGLWGCVSSSLLLIVVYYVKVNRIHEDSLDTLYALGTNVPILLIGLLYVLVILFYNLFGMLVTKISSAVVRTIMEAIRTACIWVVNLIIRQIVLNVCEEGSGLRNLGEVWTNWSFLQAGGFIILLLGMLIYNGIIKIKCLSYEPIISNDDDDK